MHSIGLPKVPHTHVGYGDVMEALEAFFEEELVACAMRRGFRGRRWFWIPGWIFAKQKADNLRIYAELERLHRFGRPIYCPFRVRL